MNIGYACLTLGVPDTDFKSCIQRNASNEKLVELIAHNLDSLENIIDYNIENQIRLFRISSDLIPFASSKINKLHWWDLFETQFSIIGEKLKAGNIRVSMHPGQYTVLNSPDQDVVKRAIEDLNYHARVLDALYTDGKSKIVLHIGGIYGDKTLAMERFEENYKRLNPGVRRRIVIENDDRSYTIEDVLELGTKLGIPVIYDNLHHRVNPVPCVRGHHHDPEVANAVYNDAWWIGEAGKTWKEKDGHQKIHYSQQEPGKRPGAHSSTIDTDAFLAFHNEIKMQEIDIMLEVKDKNLSALKCRNLISERKEIKALEQEWGRYKYAVLERSQSGYNAIRTLLREKSEYPVTVFYRMLEDAMKTEPQTGSTVNAAEHVWGYFKTLATEAEKREFHKRIEEYRQGKANISRAKKLLWRLAEKYQQRYLLNSCYFIQEDHNSIKYK